ncbi:MAG: hypothetical protein P1U62_00745 [Alteraurantiacibacter sp. bin_em_oilr2.035]|nr:hypothetical protein [Alteraurantiacibacter sp. bin_em_oilr2.035]
MDRPLESSPGPDRIRRLAIGLGGMAVIACFLAANARSSGPAEAAGSTARAINDPATADHH